MHPYTETETDKAPSPDELLQENAQLKTVIAAQHMQQDMLRKHSAHREWSTTVLMLGALYGIIFLILQLKGHA